MVLQANWGSSWAKYTTVSSAYSRIWMVCWSNRDNRSFTYNIKNTGPRMEPWGTPYFMSRSFDGVFSILTHCFL